MRGLFVQFLAPVVVILLGLAGGALAESLGLGAAIGAVVGLVMAALLAHRANSRLERVERVLRQADDVDVAAEVTIDVHDRIDQARRSAAQKVLSDATRMESTLVQLNQQAQVLDRMNDGLMRVGRDGRVSYANVAAGSLFGGRNPVGRTFMAVTRDHELNRLLRDSLESGAEHQHTFEIAGEGRLVNAVTIRLSERPSEALVMLRDITEVNRLQNLRRDFVSNVSHELRTPLSTIKILTETLLDLREDDDEATTFLNKIDGEVDSMTVLVRDLLDLTRLETVGGRLALREIDATLLVEDVCGRMRPLAERHDVRLAADAGGDVGTFVGDERRLHQALINLITNAIVHTPAGGMVSVEARPDDGGICFVVRDTGSGIPSDDLPRIWERFFKADKARTGPGTGLGLAIVKHIVQAHEGTVSVTSELGRGSEFRFVIPKGLGPVLKAPTAFETSVAPN